MKKAKRQLFGYSLDRLSGSPSSSLHARSDRGRGSIGSPVTMAGSVQLKDPNSSKPGKRKRPQPSCSAAALLALVVISFYAPDHRAGWEATVFTGREPDAPRTPFFRQARKPQEPQRSPRHPGRLLGVAAWCGARLMPRCRSTRCSARSPASAAPPRIAADQQCRWATIGARASTIRFNADIARRPRLALHRRPSSATDHGPAAARPTLAFYRPEPRTDKARHRPGCDLQRDAELKAGAYFNKIECFCFDQSRRWAPGESRRHAGVFLRRSRLSSRTAELRTMS